jgi:hypothetical protein
MLLKFAYDHYEDIITAIYRLIQFSRAAFQIMHLPKIVFCGCKVLALYFSKCNCKQSRMFHESLKAKNRC